MNFVQKIYLLPGLAVLAFCLIFVISLRSGTKTEDLMIRVEKGYFPASELGNRLQESLKNIQRGMQDAVQAADLSKLEEVDALQENLIKDLQARLQKGEDFAALAQVYSQAPTASSGGDLGFFEIQLLTPQIRDALEGLTAGQFSDIVETDQGYQLFMVEEIQTTGGQSLEEASESIGAKLYSERMEEKFKLWLADMRGKAHIRIIE